MPWYEFFFTTYGGGVSMSLMVGSLTAMLLWGLRRRNQRRVCRQIEAEVKDHWRQVALWRGNTLAYTQRLSAAVAEATKPEPKPFDPLDPNADKQWCISCDGIKPSAGFCLTRDQLHWFCADCRRDYDDPEGVLNPRPVVNEQTQQFADALSYDCRCAGCGGVLLSNDPIPQPATCYECREAQRRNWNERKVKGEVLDAVRHDKSVQALLTQRAQRLQELTVEMIRNNHG